MNNNDGDLRPPESYALASIIGCGIMAVAFCAVGIGLWLLIGWLAG